jgi:hypothetical protein
VFGLIPFLSPPEAAVGHFKVVKDLGIVEPRERLVSRVKRRATAHCS